MVGLKKKSPIREEIMLSLIPSNTRLNTPYKNSTINSYIIRLCDFTSTIELNDIDNIKSKLSNINKLESYKQTCNAIKWYLTSQLDDEKKKIFNNKDIIITFVTNQIKETEQKLNQIKTGELVLKEEEKYQGHQDNTPMIWEDIIKVRNKLKEINTRILSNYYKDWYYGYKEKIYKININEDDKDMIIETSQLEIYNALLILSLYTYFPSRQRRDYYQMYYTISTFNKAINFDKSKNYITIDKKFIFNNYKNNNRYNQQKFDCPNEIYDLIIQSPYLNNITLYTVLPYTPLFTVSESDNRFSMYFTDIFSKYKLKNNMNHMNILGIRKSYYNYIKNKLDTEEITLDEYNDLIIKMGGYYFSN